MAECGVDVARQMRMVIAWDEQRVSYAALQARGHLIAQGSSVDLNGNGLLDECECLGDFHRRWNHRV